MRLSFLLPTVRPANVVSDVYTRRPCCAEIRPRRPHFDSSIFSPGQRSRNFHGTPEVGHDICFQAETCAAFAESVPSQSACTHLPYSVSPVARRRSASDGVRRNPASSPLSSRLAQGPQLSVASARGRWCVVCRCAADPRSDNRTFPATTSISTRAGLLYHGRPAPIQEATPREFCFVVRELGC